MTEPLSPARHSTLRHCDAESFSPD